MTFKATVEITFKIPEAIKEVEKATSDMLDGAATVVAMRAKDAVAPGRGPGPHPHRTPHIDTGDLMRDIQVGEEYKEGEVLVREVGNTEATPYGKFLEVGWFSRGGNFFRYPWLWPSLESSASDIRRVIATTKL